jgi:hypothetical protein
MRSFVGIAWPLSPHYRMRPRSREIDGPQAGDIKTFKTRLLASHFQGIVKTTSSSTVN